jgi:hypothetical protein
MHHVPRPATKRTGQANWARAACTRAATWPARRATAVHSLQVAEGRQLKTARDRHRDLLRLPQERAREDAAHSRITRCAKARWAASSCHNPHDGSRTEDDEGGVGERDLLHVPRREARPVPLRARAGARGLREPATSRTARTTSVCWSRSCRTLCWNCHLHGLRALRVGRQPVDGKGRSRRAHGSPCGLSRRRTRGSSSGRARTAT